MDIKEQAILITGSKGFIGRNLIAQLHNEGINNILEFDKDTDRALLEEYTNKCDFVFHLAGVNRPKDDKEFKEGNSDLTAYLMELLKANPKRPGVAMTSSIQAALSNPYGESKKAGEGAVFSYGEQTGAPVFVYRLPNVFGKWSRPNYNTVVATFCHNVARDIPIQVNDRSTMLRFVYIDDVVQEFIAALAGRAASLSEGIIYGSSFEGRSDSRSVMTEPALFPEDADRYKGIRKVFEISLGGLADMIASFKETRKNLSVPDMSDALTSAMYSTYLSFLPEDEFAYDLKMNEDQRGSFTEFIRNEDRGQVSVNISHPGITKGQHWHHSKNEKFLVVKGEGLIRFRRIDSEEVIEYRVNGRKLQVVDIPTGYTHSIVNIGNEDMVTVMWASEPFDPEHPDTYYMEV